MSFGKAVDRGLTGAGIGAVAGMGTPASVPLAVGGGILGFGSGLLESDPSGPGPWNDASGSFTSEKLAQERASGLGGLGYQQAFAGGQNALDAMYGRGTSVAQAQLAQAQQAYNNQAMAMSASARGIDPAAAYRQAMVSQQVMAGQAAQQAATLRAQEIAAARAQVLAAGSANTNVFQDQQRAYSDRKEAAYAGVANANASISNANADRDAKIAAAFGAGVSGEALKNLGKKTGGSTPDSNPGSGGV